MITSGERIRELRIHRKKSQQELANELGYKTYTTISKWEADKALPPANDLKKLALYFEVSTDYLLGLKESPTYFITEDVHNTAKINIIGTLNVNYQDKILSPSEKESIPQIEVPQYVLEEDPDKYFVTEVRTDSFNRRINSGDNVVVLDATKAENLHLDSGSILIIKMEDNYRILLFKKTDSMIYLEPFSHLNGFETLTYSKEQFEQVEVIGKIVYVFRKFD
ncbi:Helix-turn-helix domain-containing protein [Atopostipes suicloacalis DSM 15692]|uniref:Helix-turn-helix domain-containing protein n=1 Tax=Atopostipes suicloacalis DSM 15692 TaxID=1121025 RepID=A0A1M4WD32_9LACT|nr:helix-turn-helix domain-containing protein [Atopostipes suicloacalis]SHE79085.1 Helix-turn-helix domain-containing protein [Atopostipes suicloacalis DSM 15692]